MSNVYAATICGAALGMIWASADDIFHVYTQSASITASSNNKKNKHIQNNMHILVQAGHTSCSIYFDKYGQTAKHVPIFLRSIWMEATGKPASMAVRSADNIRRQTLENRRRSIYLSEICVCVWQLTHNVSDAGACLCEATRCCRVG